MTTCRAENECHGSCWREPDNLPMQHDDTTASIKTKAGRQPHIIAKKVQGRLQPVSGSGSGMYGCFFFQTNICMYPNKCILLFQKVNQSITFISLNKCTIYINLRLFDSSRYEIYIRPAVACQLPRHHFRSAKTRASNSSAIFAAAFDVKMKPRHAANSIFNKGSATQAAMLDGKLG